MFLLFRSIGSTYFKIMPDKFTIGRSYGSMRVQINLYRGLTSTAINGCSDGTIKLNDRYCIITDSQRGVANGHLVTTKSQKHIIFQHYWTQVVAWGITYLIDTIRCNSAVNVIKLRIFILSPLSGFSTTDRVVLAPTVVKNPVGGLT